MTGRSGQFLAPRSLAAIAALGAALWLVACDGEEGARETAPGIVREFADGEHSLRLELDRDAIVTADQLGLRLAVRAPEGETVEFPEGEGAFGEFAVVREAEVSARLQDGGQVLHVREYALQPFLPGDYELPALQVRIGDAATLSTEPLSIPVTSSLIEGDAELQDIAGPLDMPVPWWWWAAGAVAALALIGGLLYWLKRRRRPDAPRRVPPHEEALAALERLLASSLLDDGEVEAFYRRLSAIVRRYVEGRFGLRAPERTTEEFLHEISGGPVISRAHQLLLRDFLQEADMVKFARFVPRQEQTGRAVTAAKAFVEQTVPPPSDSEGDPGAR